MRDLHRKAIKRKGF